MNERVVSFMQYHPVRTQRGLEILSGLIPWGVISFVILGSFIIPQFVAYLVLAFNIYCLYRSLQMSVLAISGYLNLKATTKINWLEKLQTDSRTKSKYREIFHLVIIPNVREPLVTLERNLKSLSSQNFPLKNIFVVLAMEERAREFDQDTATKLVQKYKGVLKKLIVTWHPLVVGETIGKHSNNTYAAKAAKRLLVDKNKIPIDSIVVTQCDADTVFSNQYLSLLTYKFLTEKKPFNDIFQAPIFMYNNVHRLPLIHRVAAIASGIQYLALFQKPTKRFVNISIYSLALTLLDQVDYWDVDVIPEDWHINLKAFFALKGDLSVIPIYLPIYIDAAESTTRWRTFVNSYGQVRRWAWGIVDVPYVAKKFFLHPEISLWDRVTKIVTVLETHFVWSTWWFLIVLGATIPTILNPAFARTSLGFNLSKVSSAVLSISLVGIFVIIFIDALLNPHYKSRVKHLLHPLTYLQWIISPLSGFFFSFLPGLESQTRLMLGKYLEYRVTEKV